ncbi:MAG: PAS domain S-box protein [Anaerolineae bacterium]|nr:PAS domain S-box protein [Anaerolineae bacterium]
MLKASLRISLVYGVVAALWIALSDRVVSLLAPIEHFAVIQTYKGWAFVAFTSALLFVLVRYEQARIEALQHTQRQQSLRFQRILDQAGDAIIVVDAARRIVHFNGSAERLFGYSAAEMLGKPIQNILPAVETALSWGGGSVALAPASRNGIRHMAQRRNGASFPAEVSAAQVEDASDAPQFVVIMRDVTEREHLNDLLRKSQEELEQRVNERTQELRDAIDERVAADHRLRAAMRRLETLIENLQIGVLLADRLGHVQQVNQQFCDIFSLEDKPTALTGQKESAVIRRMSAQLVGQPDLTGEYRYIESKERPQNNDRLETIDGRILLRDYIPIVEDGVCIGHLWQYRDITDQERSEEVLQTALQQMNMLYTVGRMLIVAQDIEGLLHAFCEPFMQEGPCGAALFFTGGESGDDLTWAELATQTGDCPLATYDTGARWKLDDFPFGAVLRAGRDDPLFIGDVNHHPALSAQDAARLAAEDVQAVAVVPLHSRGKRIGVVCGMWREPREQPPQDWPIAAYLAPQLAALVESRRLMVRTAEAERRYRLMADNITDLIARHAPDGSYLYVSPSVSRLLGYTPEQVIGRTPFDLCHPDHESRLREAFSALQDSAAGGPDMRTFSYLIRRADGSYTWFETAAHIVVEPSTGVAREILAVSRDVSERMQVEQDLQQARDALQKQVAERTATNERLQELDRMRSKFVSDVSHELRAPVTNLSMYLYLLERDDSTKREHYFSLLQKQVLRLKALIDNILDLSRLEMASERVVFHPLDLNSVVEPVVATHVARAESSGIDLRFEPGADLPPIFGDRERLAQVVENLVANAINYTPQGSVTVRTGTAPERGAVTLEVRDTGMGIPPEDQPGLFRRFFRASNVRQVGIPGTGLGLVIVREIVDLHKGTITLNSAPGVGTTFCVELPSLPAEPRG